MRMRSIHRGVRVNPERWPDTPVVSFPDDVGGGYFEGDVPDEIGHFLVEIGRQGEYAILATAAPPVVPVEEDAPPATIPPPVDLGGDDSAPPSSEPPEPRGGRRRR